MRILVTGASGFIGRHLVPELLDAGHEVAAMTRRPESYTGGGEPVGADVARPETLAPALAGCDVAYFLIHSLDRRDFVKRDAAAARAFGAAAEQAGVRRIVYLSGLGDETETLSAHLRSRHEVEGLLAGGGVPVTTLRAGVVIGDLSTSWEIIRQVVAHLPALVAPTWATARTQPIAVDDVVRYLVGVLDVEASIGQTLEIGGSEVLRYTDLLTRLSALQGRVALQVFVPVPSVRLAALAAAQVLPLLAGVDRRTVRALVESLPYEVVVHDDRIRSMVPFEPMDYDDAARAALRQRALRLGAAA
ncbi:NAD(P)H-binding protein [uncultured Jatrophihabitans sp.]|uniref:NAD(P)H-binding protein n=1 Tax=uncultured Jatrophihabitans sp. TaxID=1610747 RepID=UPI0035CA82D8